MQTRSTVRLAQNQLKRQRGMTLEDHQPHPSTRADMERETSITSNTDTMNGSKKRVVVQIPHVAPTGHDQRAMEIEESPAENLISQIKALECEKQSLKEEMEEQKRNYYRKRYQMTKDFVLRNGALEAALKQKSRDLEEQLKVTKNLASDYEYEIKSLKDKLHQEIQETRKYFDERLNIMENRNEVMIREIRLLKQRLEATQKLEERLRAAEDHAQKQEVQRRRDLEQYEAFLQEEEHKAFLRLKQETAEHLAHKYRELEDQLEFAKDLINKNESTTYEILSLRENLKTAAEQNTRSHQEIRKLYEKQLILESKIQSLSKELEAAQNGSPRVQNIREEQLIKPTTPLNRASAPSAMNCHCMRCVVGLHCQATK